MKYLSKICNIKIIGDVVVFIVIVLSTFVTFFSLITNKDGIPSVNGYSPFSIQSDSMYPTLKKGDLIFVDNKYDFNKLKNNDIISFYSYEQGTNIIKTHRIIDISTEDNTRLYKTKGDNNDIEDSVFITNIDIIGKYKYKISYLGKCIDFLKNKWVFFIVILIPLSIIFVYSLVEFIKLLVEYKMNE